MSLSHLPIARRTTTATAGHIERLIIFVSEGKSIDITCCSAETAHHGKHGMTGSRKGARLTYDCAGIIRVQHHHQPTPRRSHSQLTSSPHQQSLRRPRVHSSLQRAQARQEHQMDHLQDLRRLERNRRRGNVDRLGLQQVPGEAAERQEQEQARRGGHGWPVCGV